MDIWQDLLLKTPLTSEDQKNKYGRLVKFSPNMKLSMYKEKFLANKQNKQEFLRFLVSYMNSANLYTKQCFSDADVLIAKTAIDILVDENVVNSYSSLL